MEINTKKRYISYSEVSCFYDYGKDDYFKSYILGIKEPKSQPLILGSIIHEMLAEPNYDWKSELTNAGFTSDYIRIVDKINLNAPRYDIHEFSLFVDTDMGFSLYAGIDAIKGTKEKPIKAIDYKTSKYIMDKTKADESEQATHYIYTINKQIEEIIPFTFIGLSTLNGKIKEVDTFRTKEQLNNWEKKLIQFKKDLIKLNFWEHKIPFNSRIQL